jgi:hypothetical protein
VVRSLCLEGAIDDVSGRGAIAHGEAFGLACRRQRLADRVHLLDETHREELIEKLLGVLLDVDRPRRVAPFLSRFERRLRPRLCYVQIDHLAERRLEGGR